MGPSSKRFSCVAQYGWPPHNVSIKYSLLEMSQRCLPASLSFSKHIPARTNAWFLTAVWWKCPPRSPHKPLTLRVVLLLLPFAWPAQQYFQSIPPAMIKFRLIFYGVITLIFIVNVIGHYVIQLVRLLAFIRMHSFVSLNFTWEGVIIITARDITARRFILIWCLSTDLIDLINFRTWTVSLGHYKELIVLFFKSFKLRCAFIFRLMVMLDISGPLA